MKILPRSIPVAKLTKKKMCRPNCNRCLLFFTEAGGLKSAYKIIIFMKRLSELLHSNKLYQYKFEYNHSFMDIYAPSSSFLICVLRASGAYRYGKQWQCGISWKSILLLIMLQLLSIFFLPSLLSLFTVAYIHYKLSSGPAYSGTLSKHYYLLKQYISRKKKTATT